jgi:hypothetical protein
MPSTKAAIPTVSDEPVDASSSDAAVSAAAEVSPHTLWLLTEPPVPAEKPILTVGTEANSAGSSTSMMGSTPPS